MCRKGYPMKINPPAEADKKSIPTTYREVRISDTIYRLTSQFEGGKDLDATLLRLAIKRVTNFREEDFSDQNRWIWRYCIV